MAFKNLNSDEMLQLSGTWTDPATKAYVALTASDDLKPSMPKLTSAHNGLSDAEQPSKIPRIEEIVAEEAKLDVRHDAIIRCGWGFLTVQAELIGGDEGTALLALRDVIFPEGLSMQLKSYRAEAGQASQMALRMTPAVRAETDGILVGKGPSAKKLTAYIDELLDLGKQLGALEDERGKLEDEDGTGGVRLKARNQWIRVVNALVANAALADLDAETDNLLFGALRTAEKKADQRAREAAAAKAKAIQATAGAKAGAGATGSAGATGATGPGGGS